MSQQEILRPNVAGSANQISGASAPSMGMLPPVMSTLRPERLRFISAPLE